MRHPLNALVSPRIQYFFHQRLIRFSWGSGIFDECETRGGGRRARGKLAPTTSVESRECAKQPFDLVWQQNAALYSLDSMEYKPAYSTLSKAYTTSLSSWLFEGKEYCIGKKIHGTFIDLCIFWRNFFVSPDSLLWVSSSTKSKWMSSEFTLFSTLCEWVLRIDCAWTRIFCHHFCENTSKQKLFLHHWRSRLLQFDAFGSIVPHLGIPLGSNFIHPIHWIP